jgi:small subunit ribosomal protein S1
VDPLNGEAALATARNAGLRSVNGEVFLGAENVEAALHTDQIDALVSPFSAYVPIRHFINYSIRRIAEEQNIIVEGRDMTTEVFPDAKCRFYLDASPEVRARRRFEQGVSGLSEAEILRSIQERDELDRNKPEGSLKIAPGVHYLDTTPLTINQVYVKLLEITMKEGIDMGQMESGTIMEESMNSAAEEGSGALQEQLQEQYLKPLDQLEEGNMVDGVVVQVTQDQVFVDVGYKSEGKIPLSEFAEEPKVGDVVQVVLVTKENKYGEVIVSKSKADVKLMWKNLRQAFQDHTAVEGVIDKQIKGGYEVDLGGDTRAFLPISQADVQRVEKPEKLVGQKCLFYVERLYSDGKVNVVVNRRKYLEEEVESKRNDFFENTEVGAEIDGVVKSFTSFGAFVDLGGFDGLLHVNDMSWGHVLRPKDVVKKGQELKVKVVRIDPVEKRINLSLKHFTDDPWVHFEEKYHVNDVVKGKVTKLTDFGAFIELEEGIEGLAHISEFSWVKKVHKPQDILSIGDEVECMILGYDLQEGRVSLGLKQVTANPWSDIDSRYPVGTRLTRKVVKLTNAGAFIQLEDGIDGFLHGDDISWTKKVKHPGSELKVGDEIEVMVIANDPESRNIRLGIKQLGDDPWVSFAQAYKQGSLVEGEVSSITDFGVFMKVPGGIEGLIHKTNLPENREESPEDALKKYNVGDKIKAVVLEIAPDKQKVAFSIKDYQKKMQRDELSRYMAAEESDGSSFTLGDMLKIKGGNKESAE